MNRKQKLEFAEKRIEGKLNGSTKKEIEEYADNITIEGTKDGEFIDDGAHAYLVVRPTHPHFMQALVQLDQSPYNYYLSDGTVLLEEDVDAPKFLKTTKNEQ